MNFCQSPLVLYQLHHPAKLFYFQYIRWYSNCLFIYTISKPTKPKTEKTPKSGVAGAVGGLIKNATTPAVSRVVSGLRPGGTAGTAKIAFFLFFIFVAIFRANPSFWRARAAP